MVILGTLMLLFVLCALRLPGYFLGYVLYPCFWINASTNTKSKKREKHTKKKAKQNLMRWIRQNEIAKRGLEQFHQSMLKQYKQV